MRNSILESLTEEQRDQLYDWLMEMPIPKVAEKIARPAPEGFGIPVHITTLQRFKNRRWAEHTADQLEDAAQLADATTGHDATLDNGIASALKRHFFQTASAPDATDAQLSMVARWFHRNEKHKLDVQRVQIARERLAQGDQRILQNNRRLDLLERTVKVREETLALRREQLAAKAESNEESANERRGDELGPFARNLSEVGERVRKHLGITPEESARRRELRKTWVQPHPQKHQPKDTNPLTP